MDARFLHPSAWKDPDEPAPAVTGRDEAMPGHGDRSCCCVARAVVRVVLPPTSSRPHETELLLCGHHYRSSRRALAAARARVTELPGVPGDTTAWIHGDRIPAPRTIVEAR
jgi:hypothetical protein